MKIKEFSSVVIGLNSYNNEGIPFKDKRRYFTFQDIPKESVVAVCEITHSNVKFTDNKRILSGDVTKVTTDILVGLQYTTELKFDFNGELMSTVVYTNQLRKIFSEEFILSKIGVISTNAARLVGLTDKCKHVTFAVNYTGVSLGSTFIQHYLDMAYEHNLKLSDNIVVAASTLKRHGDYYTFKYFYTPSIEMDYEMWCDSQLNIVSNAIVGDLGICKINDMYIWNNFKSSNLEEVKVYHDISKV